MTEAQRKARLAELELAASSPWASNETLLALVDALDEESRRIAQQLEATRASKDRPSPLTRKAETAPAIDTGKYRPEFRIGRSSEGYDPLEFIETDRPGFTSLVAGEMGRAFGEMESKLRREFASQRQEAITMSNQAEVDQQYNSWFEKSIQPYMDFVAEQLGEYTGTIQHEVDKAKAKISELQTELRQATSQVRTLQKSQTDLTATVTKLRAEMLALRGENVLVMPPPDKRAQQ